MLSNSIAQKFTPLTLIRFALPSMVMMIFMSCYTIVDGIFISRFVGSHGLSAVNLVYPVINILFAVGIMLATGGSAFVATELGEGRPKDAQKHFSLLVFTSVLASVILLIVTLLFIDPISLALGADQALLPYCRAYLGVTILFGPACMLQTMFQSFFVTAGKPHYGLILTITAGIANAVLDYVFMGVLGFGVEGAALATGLGQAVPAVFGLFYFGFSKNSLRFRRFRAEAKVLVQSCLNGSSEMVSNLSNAVVTYMFNIVMMRLAGADGVASITILLYAQFLFNSLYLGFSMGVAPVISFQHGAGKKDELKNTYRISKLFTLGSAVGITVLSLFMADFVAKIFVEPGTAVYELTRQGFRIFAFSFLFSGYNIYSSALFTALSDGKTSAILSFSRTFVFILLSLLLLPAVLGVTGAWLAIPLAEFVTVFLSMFYNRRLNKGPILDPAAQI